MDINDKCSMHEEVTTLSGIIVCYLNKTWYENPNFLFEVKEIEIGNRPFLNAFDTGEIEVNHQSNLV